jgi:hypothetical protein
MQQLDSLRHHTGAVQCRIRAVNNTGSINSPPETILIVIEAEVDSTKTRELELQLHDPKDTGALAS